MTNETGTPLTAKKKLINAVLLVVAFVLLRIFWCFLLAIEIISWPIRLVAKQKGIAFPWMRQVAVSIDQLGNALGSTTLNFLCIKRDTPHRFGQPDEVISSVVGKNGALEQLTWLGKCLRDLLHKLDPNHSLGSIEYDVSRFDEKERELLLNKDMEVEAMVRALNRTHAELVAAILVTERQRGTIESEPAEALFAKFADMLPENLRSEKLAQYKPPPEEQFKLRLKQEEEGEFESRLKELTRRRFLQNQHLADWWERLYHDSTEGKKNPPQEDNA